MVSMKISVKLPYEVWREGLNKWVKLANATAENYRQLWGRLVECSFCDYFGSIHLTNVNSSICDDCNECPLGESRSCASEYFECNRADEEEDFPVFHANAVILRDKIKKLPHKEKL
jgi:hypothetical protein